MVLELSDEKLRELLRLAEAASSDIPEWPSSRDIDIDGITHATIAEGSFIATISSDVARALVEELLSARAELNFLRKMQDEFHDNICDDESCRCGLNDADGIWVTCKAIK